MATKSISELIFEKMEDTSIQKFINKSLEDRLFFVEQILRADSCFTDARGGSFSEMAAATLECLISILNFMQGGWMLTKYGSWVIFRPDGRTLERERDVLSAWIKYAAHFVTNRTYENGLPIISYSSTKHRNLPKLLPTVIEPDKVLYSKARITALYHFKFFPAEGKNNVLAAFELEVEQADNTSTIRAVSYMPDKKSNWLQKQLSDPNSDILK